MIICLPTMIWHITWQLKIINSFYSDFYIACEINNSHIVFFIQCSCYRSFSKLKVIKIRLWSLIDQDRLRPFIIILINSEVEIVSWVIHEKITDALKTHQLINETIVISSTRIYHTIVCKYNKIVNNLKICFTYSYLCDGLSYV